MDKNIDLKTPENVARLYNGIRSSELYNIPRPVKKENRVSVMVAFTPNPYLALHFFDHMKNWIGDVDEVFIAVEGENTKFNGEIKNFISNLFLHNKISNFEYGQPMDQGEVFDKMFPFVTGDILVTMDSDYIIKKRGYLKKYLKQIESGTYDIIGSRGGACYKELRAFLDPYVAHDKDKNLRVNPFLSFWKVETLKKIVGLSFAGKEIKKGDIIFPKAEVKAPADGWVDPFVLAYLAYTEYDKKIFITKQDAEPPDTFHYSGMSWTYRYYLSNENGLTPDGTLVGNKFKLRIFHLALHIALYENYRGRYPDKEYNDFVGETLEQHRGFAKDHKQLLEDDIKIFNAIIKL